MCLSFLVRAPHLGSNILRMHTHYAMNLFVMICKQGFTCYVFFILKACSPVFTVYVFYIQYLRTRNPHSDALSRIYQRGNYIVLTEVHNRFFFSVH